MTIFAMFARLNHPRLKDADDVTEQKGAMFKKQCQDWGLLPTKELTGVDEIGVNGPLKDS